MKIIKIVLIILLVLIVLVAAAAAIFLKTLDVNRYKPQIVAAASKALNRPVDFSRMDLGVSLVRGLNLKISNLSVGDDPRFQKGDFMTVRGVSLAVDALGFLMRRQITVPGVGIDTARLAVIRQKDGSLNVETLAKGAATAPAGSSSGTAATALAVPALLISSLTGSGSSLVYIDRQFDPPLSLEINAIGFTVTRISLSEPFPFVVEASVLSPKQNVRIEGTVRIDPKTMQAVVTNLEAVSDLSLIALDKIPASLPMVQKQALPSVLNGKVRIKIPQLAAGPAGLSALNAQAKIDNGVIGFRGLAQELKGLSLNSKITEKDIRVEEASASLGSGSIQASGDINEYAAGQSFNFVAEAKDLDLQGLIEQSASPVKIEGTAAGKFAVKGKGFSPEAVRETLTGTARLSVLKPKLKDLNVLRMVLDKVSVIPGLSEKIEAGLPERFKKKLTQKDTALSDIDIPAVIENGRFSAEGLVLSAEEFVFRGRAQAGFDGAYAIEGAFLIPAELSAAMIAAVPQLQYLLNDAQEISLPLKISGKAGAVRFNVDPQYIAEKLLATQAKQQLFKALDKALGPKQPAGQGASPAAQSGSASPAADKAQNTTTQDPLKELIGSIFK